MKGHLRKRIWDAWDAFRDAPAPHYLVCEMVEPLGWRVLGEFDDYDEAHQFRQRYQTPVRIFTDETWLRLMDARMRSGNPYLAVARLLAELQNAKRDLDDERAMRRAVVLDGFAEHHHP